jgi:hypothetical protein
VKLEIQIEISIENLRILEIWYKKGVIIVSSTKQSGYKLAVKTNPVQFTLHYLNYTIQCWKRVEIANNIFIDKTVELHSFEQNERIKS